MQAFMGRGLVRFLSLILAAAFLLTGCVFQRSEDATRALQKMVGMKKEQVLACMGPPAKKAHEGETDVWNYHSTNGDHDYAGDKHKYGNDTFGFAEGYRYFCDVNVVMTNGVVAAVHYNGPRGGWLTENEQCGYAVEHCVEE
jgi:hypothetical protein